MESQLVASAACVLTVEGQAQPKARAVWLCSSAARFARSPKSFNKNAERRRK